MSVRAEGRNEAASGAIGGGGSRKWYCNIPILRGKKNKYRFKRGKSWSREKKTHSYTPTEDAAKRKPSNGGSTCGGWGGVGPGRRPEPIEKKEGGKNAEKKIMSKIGGRHNSARVRSKKNSKAMLVTRRGHCRNEVEEGGGGAKTVDRGGRSKLKGGSRKRLGKRLHERRKRGSEKQTFGSGREKKKGGGTGNLKSQTRAKDRKQKTREPKERILITKGNPRPRKRSPIVYTAK